MTLEEQIHALDELKDQRGWHLIKARMEQEIATLAKNLGQPAPLSTDMIHFYRGAIWAAGQLLDLPMRLRAVLENELHLEAALQAHKDGPASAGPKE